jgi:hypothetical protein
MVSMVTGLQGVQATLHDVLQAFRQSSFNPATNPNGSVGSPETRRVGSHTSGDNRRQSAGPTAYAQTTHHGESHQTPSSVSSYENQYSPATGVHPHGPYASTAPQVSGSSQPATYPTFHPAIPNLPPISPAGTSVMPPPRFPTSLPPIRSTLLEYQSNVRSSQPGSYPFQRPGSRANNSSNVTSADSSDDDGAGELPGAGLVAPLEVLRGLGEEHELRAVREFDIQMVNGTDFLHSVIKRTL